MKPRYGALFDERMCGAASNHEVGQVHRKAQKALKEAAVDVTGNEPSFSKAKVAVSAA
jgi:hypothetical protein